MKLEFIALQHIYEYEATTESTPISIYEATSYTFEDTQYGPDLFDLAMPDKIYTRIMNPTTNV